jgi:hypothetical protein
LAAQRDFLKVVKMVIVLAYLKAEQRVEKLADMMVGN